MLEPSRHLARDFELGMLPVMPVHQITHQHKETDRKDRPQCANEEENPGLGGIPLGAPVGEGSCGIEEEEGGDTDSCVQV